MVVETVESSVVVEMASKYCNWFLWGSDDELGTMNCVTAEMVTAAARLVRRGKVFSLALALNSEGPQRGTLGRCNPIHLMLQDGGDIATGAQDAISRISFTDDVIYMPLQCATQWDSLAHIYYEKKMYNGYGTEVVDSTGAHRNSITNIKDRAVGRGVLLDMARFKGKEWMAPGEPIYLHDLEECASKQGVAVGEGDFVLVRTGFLAFVRSRGFWGDAYDGGPAPGLAVSAADFFCPRKVAAVATDTWGIEVLPNETPDVYQPLHIIMLRSCGITIGEMFDLEVLAADCAEDRVYEFFFVAPPLTITGAVGSPLNPQAIK